MEKIGILGGTFDPIHNGHLRMGTLAKDFLGLSRVILVPAGVPPHKAGTVSSVRDRLKMCILAAEQADFEVSDYELLKDGASYTADTLEHFRKLYPKDGLVFILGGDSLDYIEKWHDALRIFRLCELAAIPRRGADGCRISQVARELGEKYGAVVHLLDTDYIDISSTGVREAVYAGLDISRLVPPAVESYIRDNKLYR